MTDMRKLFLVLFAATGLLAAVVLIWRGNQYAAPGYAAHSELRVVSLAPSVTEILFKLGVEKSLVGATDHCDYPPEALNIERVGGFGAPNVEKLLALSPT